MMLSDLNKTFSENPVSLDMHRSRFSLNQTHKTTLSEGDLVPVYFKEVLPGDTFSIDTAFLVRMATPIFPVMDNCFIDLYYFYVPNRIVWDHWQEFLGENTSAPWAQTVTYNVPQLKFGRQWSADPGSYNPGDETIYGYGPLKGSVMNYLGIPCLPPCGYLDSDTVVHYPTSLTVSDLPNRAYRLIWNEFFRDQNLQTPVPVYTDDSDREYYDYRASFSGQSDVGRFYDYGGAPLRVCKFHDYFTSCLPSPQKGPAVYITGSSGLLTVFASDAHRNVFTGSLGAGVDQLSFAYRSLSTDNWIQQESYPTGVVGLASGSKTTSKTNSDPSNYQITPDNLVASPASYSFSVSSIRQAFAVQRLYEAFARGGTRYREILKSIFGVTAPDARVQVPEYLGGTRVPINMDQVLQTSSTDNVSPQGNTSGYSLTTHVDNSFTKSFVEHGMIIGLACVRVEHTYCQGIEPYWFRKRTFDFYFPQFANLSEQPVFSKNLFCTGTDIDNNVFGYQEAWADYRFSPNRLSGDFSVSSYYSGTSETYSYFNSPLADAWTYNDFYGLDISESGFFDEDSFPVLSSDWIEESDVNIDQTIAVPSEPQFIADFRFKVVATRPMPVRSIPGLIDHH